MGKLTPVSRQAPLPRPAIPRLFDGCLFRRAGFPIAWPLMEPPRRYSVTPWYSFVTVTTPQHVPSLTESLRLIWRWLRGVQPNWRDAAREARVIEALAAEMEVEPETSSAMDEISLKAKPRTQVSGRQVSRRTG
jgi:hypothetical protein